MKKHDDRVTIAQVPAGQPLDLFSAVLAFFGAAIDGAVIADGDGGSVAARLLGPAGHDYHRVAESLRAAAEAAGGRPTTHTESLPEDTQPLTIGHVLNQDEGLTFGLGGSELAEQFASRLLAVFLPAMEEMGAENYVEYEGFDRETNQRLLLIVVKPGGKRPSVLRQEAEAEVARLRALLVAHGIEDAA